MNRGLAGWWLGSAVLACTALLGCSSAAPVAALAAAEGATVAVFGRGIVDVVVSAISGRDCSVVRLEQGKTYCDPIDPPRTEPYCTRSLGAVDCWDLAVVPAIRRPEVGDTPLPNRAQRRYQAARWPKSLTFE